MGLPASVLKGDYADNTDWSEWTQEMQDYCQQDVVVTARLWQHLEPHKWSKQSIKLEHSLAEVCHRIGEAGWTFDEKKAAKFYADLAQERADLQQELDELFPPWIVEEEFIPKVNNRKLGYTKGEPFINRRGRMNPNSRKHIEFLSAEEIRRKPTESATAARKDRRGSKPSAIPRSQETCAWFPAAETHRDAGRR